MLCNLHIIYPTTLLDRGTSHGGRYVQLLPGYCDTCMLHIY